MQRPTVMGDEIVKGSCSKCVRMGALIELGHNEKYDGTGYPNGLVGEHIPLCARIIAVADVFDALTSVRPYKQAWPPARAFAYIDEQRGKPFDPRLAAAFISAKTQIQQLQSHCSD